MGWERAFSQGEERKVNPTEEGKSEEVPKVPQEAKAGGRGV